MMSVTKQFSGLALAAVVSMAATQSAWAVGTADVKYAGVLDNSDTTTGHITEGLVKVWGDNQNGTPGKGGIYVLDIGATTGDGNDIIVQSSGPFAGQVFAFCIELQQFATDTFQTYDVEEVETAPSPDYAPIGGNIGTAKADLIRELWYNEFAGAANGGLGDGHIAEAMSLAIWEIIYEDLPESFGGNVGEPDYDVSVWTVEANSFRAVDLDALGTVALANSMLADLTGAANAPKANLKALTFDGVDAQNRQYQDFLVEVPEPASLALLGTGSVMMLYRRRRAS